MEGLNHLCHLLAADGTETLDLFRAAFADTDVPAGDQNSVYWMIQTNRAVIHGLGPRTAGSRRFLARMVPCW